MAPAAFAVVVALVLTACTSTAAPRPHVTDDSVIDFLPDEPRLLFEWYLNGDSVKSQFLADAQGLAAVAVTTDVAPGIDHVHSDWSPDGTKIAFETLDDSGASIWIADSDGKHSVQTITCESAGCTQQSYPSWSPDGKSIVFVQGDGVPDNWGAASIVVFDLASKTRRTLAVTAGGTAAFYSPRWSRDGSQVVAQYETYPDATESTISSSEIVMVPADGSAPPRSLTDPAMFAGHPDWSPTEDLIVFDTYDLSAFFPISPAGTESNLFLIRPDGSGLRKLTDTTQAKLQRLGEPSWTPDGARIVATLGSLFSTDDLHINDAMTVYVDPTSGALDKTGISGAGARLQPVRS